MPLNLRHSEGSRASISSSSHARLLLFLFSALLAQPPFHHTTACPTGTRRLQWSLRRSSDRNRASDRAVGGRTPRCRGLTQRRGFGVLHGIWREPPENWESGGAKRAGKKETQLTISAFNFPQFTQIHSRIFFTFTKNPFLSLRVL